MGSSGAGKSTLLNALSGRLLNLKGQKLEGKITLGGSLELNQKSFSKYACYVTQDDILFEYFTPEQALRFASRLKLHRSVEEQE